MKEHSMNSHGRGAGHETSTTLACKRSRTMKSLPSSTIIDIVIIVAVVVIAVVIIIAVVVVAVAMRIGEGDAP
eukprot:4151057-Lingulodinium_polyedra.AAC.1